MRRLLLALFASSALAACGSDDAASTASDTGADVDYGDGPITTRPDDGVDTAITDSGTDSGTDTGGADGAGSDSAVTDSATTDSASTDTGSSDTGAASAAHIHEVYVDRNLEGDKVEFVEIAAPSGAPIDGLWLRVFDKTGAPVFNLRVADAGVKMKSSGYWVVGTSWVSPDKTYSLSEWGLPNDGGSIQLNRLDGATNVLVDVVGFGTAPTSTTASDPKTLVEGTAAALPGSGSTNKTIGRKSVPGDTGNNATDFCVMTATPGAANGACL